MLASVRERRHMRFEVRDLVVRYPGAIRPALDGISMTVPDGCFYAVLGPNGSGKSTLVRSMMGVIHPAAGTTSIDEREVSTWDRRELARAVGAVSQGERQRVRIARALAQQPRALVLDEPTNSLDIGHEMAILELLRRSADSGLTVVVVTHGLDLAARFADRLLLLSQGSVASEGTPAEVLTEPTLAGVYGWPVSVSTDPASGTPRVTPLRQGQV
jgi:ABC-type cobalamin/Fe3+-siderophores transport system ATPase subunit